MKTIETLLEEIGEDKHENMSTTSFKFKRDLWDYCLNEAPFTAAERNCIEFGTHKGQTTKILSHLFEHVYTINLPNHFDSAQITLADRENVTFVPMNLYQSPIDQEITREPISLVFIDAVHTFDAVMSDFTRATNLNLSGDVVFVFDDYGTYNDVYLAVEQLIRLGELEKIRYIGHPSRYSFGGTPERVLTQPEGVICKLGSF
jgi:hypothetical protein